MEAYTNNSRVPGVMDELSSIINFEYLGDENSSSRTQNLTFANETSIPPARDEFLAKVEQFVLVTIFTLTLIGNFLVLAGIYFRKQKMTRMYYFILHLCLADLCTAFFQVLTQLAWEITYRFQGGPFMCKFVKYIQILGPYSSSYVLVMTALDRYQALCYPLSNCSWTARRSKMMLGSAWILSILFCLPQLFIFSYQELQGGVFDCWGTFIDGWGEKAYITWYCISVFIVPLIILIFAYTCITRVIWLNFSMKNAIIQEQKKSVMREDSDDMNEHELDQTVADNDSSIFHENCRNPEKNMNERKLLVAHGSDPHRPKNLEVSWHQGKSGPQTKTSMSSNSEQPHELPTSILQNKCQPNSDSINSDLVKDPNYISEDRQYLSPLNLSNRDKERGNNTQCSSFDTRKNYNNSRKAAIDKLNTPVMERNTMGSEKKRHQTWRSVSLPSPTDNRVHKEVNESPRRKLKGPTLSLLTSNGSSQKKGVKSVSRAFSVRSSALSNVSQPRTHSVKGISRAKIKTIKLTVTVICCYIICSTPFIAALLWMSYDPSAKEHPFFYGPTFTILTLLASLNSCANSFIVLFFNPNLLQSFYRGTCGRLFGQHSRGSTSLSASQRKQMYNSKFLSIANCNPRAATSVTGLSPVINRFSPKEYGNNRSKNGHDAMELIPSSKNVNTPISKPLLTTNENNYPVEISNKDASTPVEASFIDI